MTRSRKLLIVSGLALAIWGMCYGLYYAVFIEHQTLDQLGGGITTGFVRAAGRKMPEAHDALSGYARTQFDYVRHVDVHSHWIGLAMILFLLGLVFDRVGLDEPKRYYLALTLVVGAVTFPLGVFLQTLMAGPVPSALAIGGSALVTVGLGGVALGFAREGRPA